MLEDLQTQVVIEGKAEAKTYDKFACLCKDETSDKTDAIRDGTDHVADLEATIAKLAATRTSLDDEITRLNKKIGKLSDSIDRETQKNAKLQSEYLKTESELSKGRDNLKDALKMLKHGGGVSLLGVTSITATLRNALAMEDAMGPNSQKRKQLISLLQQPDVPMQDFSFHSEDIMHTIQDIHADFKTKLSNMHIEETKRHAKHHVMMQSKEDEKYLAEKDLKHRVENKAQKMELIGQNSRELAVAKAALSDDQAYLKDLTQKCNEKAKAWDQRSKIRSDELSALTSALTVVKGQVTESAKATQSSLVRMRTRDSKMMVDKDLDEDAAAEKQMDGDLAEEEYSLEEAANEDPADEEDDDDEDVALVQVQHPRKRLNALARKTRAHHRHLRVALKKKQKSIVAELLTEKSKQLNSLVLAKLAAHAAADPFGKIKTLVQELIEKLLQEEADEADHKGWCDKELTKAKETRARKAEEIKKLNAELSMLEVKCDKTNEESDALTKEIVILSNSLDKLAKEREEESTENAATVKEAQEGKEAVEEAIDILQKFYGTAAKAEVESLIQRCAKVHGFEAPNAGIDGAYKGSQSASGGVIGMLEVIQSDFHREITETQKDEKAAAAEYMEFETTTKTSKKTKETTKSALERELTEINSLINEHKNSLTSEQELLDKAIQELLELQPACIDTGMSYEQRMAKREQEQEALKQALCILDQQGPVQTESC